MTLKDLKERVDAHTKRRGWEDLEVCIPNGKPGMGPIGTTNVKSVTQGIDWEKSLFIIWPEVKMQERNN